ncbi:hypothetical protein J6590_075327 [Homalodisca vitripennis]|nr:hypothetical protein J6590_075327 [Homalodisca vitripennis]
MIPGKGKDCNSKNKPYALALSVNPGISTEYRQTDRRVVATNPPRDWLRPPNNPSGHKSCRCTVYYTERRCLKRYIRRYIRPHFNLSCRHNLSR